MAHCNTVLYIKLHIKLYELYFHQLHNTKKCHRSDKSQQLDFFAHKNEGERLAKLKKMDGSVV